MARCKHGFLLEQVSCPAGCGGNPSDRRFYTGAPKKSGPRAVAKARVVTDQEIAKALTGATSVREAREKLRIDAADFAERCRAEPELRRLYEEAKARGKKTSRERVGWRPI